MRGSAEWKPKLRWLMSRMRLLRPSRRPFERPRRIALRMPARWRRIVRASLMNGARRDLDAHVPRQPGVEVRRRERAILQLVEDSELLFQQALACWTSPSSASCGTVCLSGLLSSDQRVPLIQRPLGVCERS